jgi:hypothetical protein
MLADVGKSVPRSNAHGGVLAIIRSAETVTFDGEVPTDQA